MKKIYQAGIFILSTVASAQNNVVATGGDASGFGGSVSYSVAQAFYHISDGNGFSVLEGLQQPIEIVALSTAGTEVPILELRVYPNPTHSIINIFYPGPDFFNLEYVLSDLNGRTIQNAKITSAQTKLNIEVLPVGIYILSIKSSSQSQGYKIIKQ